MDLGDKVSKEEFCSDDVKSTLDKWTADPVEDMEAGRKSIRDHGSGKQLVYIFQLPESCEIFEQP